MPTSWVSWKKSLACKSEPGEVHDPQTFANDKAHAVFVTRRLYRSGCSRSISNLRDVIHGSRRVVEKTTNFSPRSVESSDFIRTNSQEAILRDHGYNSKLSPLENCSSIAKNSNLGYSTPVHQSVRGTPLKKFSGCYDCSSAQNPAASLVVYKGIGAAGSVAPIARPACQRCGEIFAKYEALEHHHLMKHAVAELDLGDSSRNVVEIIFRTSWLKSEMPNVKIERILKVHNMQKTLARFEEYRDMVKSKASKLAKKHPRCLADGNELLRFHGTTVQCSLGMNGSSSLCNSASCNVCRIIRWGFSSKKVESSMGKGIYTTATSGKAHDSIAVADQEVPNLPSPKKAMMVCRVIAGRVHKSYDYSREAAGPPASGFDSVAGEAAGLYSNIEELIVFNPKAILPCFVVIYKC